MKKILTLIAIAGVLFMMPSISRAEEGHEHKGEHAGEHVGGPKGGRLLENTEPRAEFFVEKDNAVTITFYDDALKPVAATEQSVIVIAQTNGSKTQLEFEKKGDLLVSKGSLPEGDDLNLVVRFQQTLDAKPLNFRFVLEKGVCDECKRVEYACICEH